MDVLLDLDHPQLDFLLHGFCNILATKILAVFTEILYVRAIGVAINSYLVSQGWEKNFLWLQWVTMAAMATMHIWSASVLVHELATRKSMDLAVPRPWLNTKVQRALVFSGVVGATLAPGPIQDVFAEQELPPWAFLAAAFALRTLLLILDPAYHTVDLFNAEKWPGCWISDFVRTLHLYPHYRSVATRRKKLAESLLKPGCEVTPHKHSPLKSRTMIRLLCMEPHPEDEDRVICDVLTYELDAAPAYRAISYYWGNPAKTHSILLGDELKRAIHITENAYNTLRAVVPLTETRFFWMDAICINQDDLVEKSHQVSMMGDIFGRAERVLACLGEDARAAQATSFLTRLAWTADYEAIRYHDIDLNPGIPYPVDNPKWEDISRLMKNPYWSRLWVVQELAVAKDLQILWGDASLSPTSLYAAGDVIAQWEVQRSMRGHWKPEADGEKGAEERPDPFLGQYLEAFRHPLYLRFARLKNQPEIPLADHIVRFRGWQTSLPQDRVFALLGVSSDGTVHPLRPNYKEDVRVLYTSVVRHTLSTGSFVAFSIAGHASPRDAKFDLPSWVPDLSTPDVYRKGDFDRRGYAASGAGSTAEFKITHNGRKLDIQGVVVDTIKICSPEPVDISHDSFSLQDLNVAILLRYSQNLASYLTHILDLARANTPEPYLNGAPRDETFMQTLTGDFDGVAHPAKDKFLTISLKELLSLLERMKKDPEAFSERTFPKPKGSDKPRWPLELLPEDQEVGLLKLTKTVVWNCFARKFAVTSRGYMALVPRGTQAGDVVCVFKGSPVPHVLRPIEGSSAYYLQGEAYVHGIMHGEAMGGGEGKVITLR